MGLVERYLEVEDWIFMAQDRNKWWTVVNTIMNLWVP
jgi:hypothetical protein